MADGLAEAISQLHLSNSVDIDDLLFKQPQRKKARTNPAETVKKLEDEFLTPSSSFSSEWLNRLQQ